MRSCAGGRKSSPSPAAPAARWPGWPPDWPRSARARHTRAQRGFLAADTEGLQERAFGGRRGAWTLDDRFHFGGYARTAAELDTFAEDFEQRHDVPVERLYVAKLLYGLVTLAREGAFPHGTTVAAVVTGRPFP